MPVSTAAAFRVGTSAVARLYLGATLAWQSGGGPGPAVVAGVTPVPVGALAGTVRGTGALSGTSPNPVGGLVALLGGTLTGALAAATPTPVGDLAGTVTGGGTTLGALAGLAPASGGALTGTVETPGGDVEHFGGANGSAWPSPWTGASGTVDQQSGAGRILTPAGSYAQAYVRRPAPDDGEALFRWQSSDFGSVDIAIRAPGPGYGNNPKWTYRHLSDAIWLSGVATGTITASTTHTVNTWYWTRIRWQGDTVRGRTWADGASEPGSWMVQATDATSPTSGNLIFRLETDDETADTGLFDDITITDLSGAGTTGALAATTPVLSGALVGTVTGGGSGFGAALFGSQQFGA